MFKKISSQQDSSWVGVCLQGSHSEQLFLCLGAKEISALVLKQLITIKAYFFQALWGKKPQKPQVKTSR